MALLSRSILRRVHFISRLGCRRLSEEPDRSKPVKFSKSEAANWRAEFTRRGTIDDDTPDAQPFIVSISLGVFLAYFLILREESDIDKRFDIFNDNLYDRVEGLEEVDLRSRRERMLDAGKSVVEIDKRLKEIQEENLKKSLQ